MVVTKLYFQADPTATPAGPPEASYRGNLRDHDTESSATYSLYFFPRAGTSGSIGFPGMGRDSFGYSYEFKGNKRSMAHNIQAHFTNTKTNWNTLLKVFHTWNKDDTAIYLRFLDAAGDNWLEVPPHASPSSAVTSYKCKVQGIGYSFFCGGVDLSFSVRWIT
jgi:hypothetical protein